MVHALVLALVLEFALGFRRESVEVVIGWWLGSLMGDEWMGSLMGEGGKEERRGRWDILRSEIRNLKGENPK